MRRKCSLVHVHTEKFLWNKLGYNDKLLLNKMLLITFPIHYQITLNLYNTYRQSEYRIVQSNHKTFEHVIAYFQSILYLHVFINRRFWLIQFISVWLAWVFGRVKVFFLFKTNWITWPCAIVLVTWPSNGNPPYWKKWLSLVTWVSGLLTLYNPRIMSCN